MSDRRFSNRSHSLSHPLRAALATAVLSAAALVAGSPAAAADLQARLRFDPADLRMRETEAGAEVSFAGLPNVGGLEEPALPAALSTFYVPEGFEVGEVRIIARGTSRIAESVRLAVRIPERSSIEGESDEKLATRAWPPEVLDPGATRLPARNGHSAGSGTLAGHRLHSVAVFPVSWDRISGEVLLATSVDVELELVPARSRSELVRERRNPSAERAYVEAIRSMVANPGDVVYLPDDSVAESGTGFSPRDLPSVNGSAVDLVIVTSTDLEDDFQPLADWKTKKGVPTAVRTVDWIEANYPAGHDRPEKIRMFLQDAYSKWGTYLVLMGGDYENVPPRDIYNRFFFGGTLIPTDQYYVCLEGDWNGDGDEYYGEGFFQSMAGDSVDLYPDVFIGRAPVETPAEVATFISKSMTYEKSPPSSYVEDVCYMAEVLFPQEWVFGDPPENITLDGKTLTDGFDLMLPGGWSRTKCYQSENTLDRGHALARLSFGHHFLTLMNHGDAFKFSVGNGLNPLVFIADTDTLTNADRLSFVMATACNPNQFDLECQGESFMNNPSGGAFAVVGPTREDFPLSASAYHESMLDIIFDKGITQLGQFMQMHRVPFIPFSVTDATPDRWTMFTKELLGDPELHLWTQEPATLAVTHVSGVTLGTPTLTVSVTDSAFAPLADALVCVSDSMGTYSRARTDASGQAFLPLNATSTGTANVVVTLAEFIPSETTFTVDPAAGPVLTVSDYTIDDDATGGSNGNGDGVLDAGETFELALAVLNGGGSIANTSSVTASVEAGTSATFDFLWNGVRDSSMVFIGPDRTNPTSVPFTLDFASPAIEYIGTPSYTFAPDSTSDAGVYVWQDREGWHVHWSAAADSVTVDGTITTDGRVRGAHSLFLEDPTDSWSVSAGEDSLTFTGTVTDRDVVDGVELSLADGTMLSVSGPTAALGNIAAGATGNGTVILDVATTARDGQIAYVDLDLTSSSGGPWSDVLALAFSGPSLEAWVFTLDDVTNPPVSGDGDGVAEVGETVRLTPSVLNRGSGSAESVAGTAIAAGGITFTDAADAYGAIASLGMSSGVDGFVFTIDDSTGTSIDLTLTDSLGRTWGKNIEFSAPQAPDSLRFSSGPGAIVLAWDPNPESDLAGYNLYRSPTAGTGHVRQNFELLRTSTRFVDEDLALPAAFYYYVTAVDSSGNESPASAEIFAWTTVVQVAGWPKSAGDQVFSSILMADIDAAGEQEVLVGSKDFKMYAWHSDAAEVPGFPVTAGGEVWGAPAAADLDKDGDLEILWGAMDSRFYAVHHDGSGVFNGNPILIDLVGGGGTFRSTCSVADVDLDAELEFFVGNDLGQLFGFNHDGTPIAAAVDSTGLFFTAPPGDATARIWGSIAIADLDLDGQRELVFTSWNDSLYVLTPDGTRKTGWPKGGLDTFQTGPSLGDIDNDGDLEVLVGGNDDNLYAYHHDGSPVLGTAVFAALPGDIRCVPALCDLDADPELEIVVSCLDGNLYAFNHDGTGFLNSGGLFVTVDNTEAFSASPLVVDVDGDGDMEIFVGHRNGNFYGFHHDGSTIVGMPIPTAEGIFSTAAAGDVDGDGDVDIAFASYDQTVNMIDFDGVSTDSSYQWATYAGNNWRTSTYEPGPWQVGVDPPAAGTFSFSLQQNAPNPFLGGTTIRFAVPREMHVSLKIYNVSGRLVRTVVDGPVPAGPNAVQWDGRDGQGRRLSSGVYFYRLDNGEQRITRKSLVLR